MIPIQLVSEAEICRPDFIRDLRNYVATMNVGSWRWPDYVADLYRDIGGHLLNERGEEFFLDMEEFERPNIREWFRDFCSRVPADTSPYVTAATRERVRILATILRASDPAGTMLWGVRPANDNDPAAPKEE